MHIYVGNLTSICSDNGLSPIRHQAIIWANDGILLIGTLRTNFSEFLIIIHTFSFTEMHLKTSSAKRRPFGRGLNVLRPCREVTVLPRRCHIPVTRNLHVNRPSPLDDTICLGPMHFTKSQLCISWHNGMETLLHRIKYWRIPSTKGQNVELRWFLCCEPG